MVVWWRCLKKKFDLEYVGGVSKAMSIDPDKLSWFELRGNVEEDIGYKSSFTLYYLHPTVMIYEEELKKLIKDDSISEMTHIGINIRA